MTHLNVIKFHSLSQVFKDGITNKLVGVSCSAERDEKSMVLVRIYGEKTEAIIDRESEIHNIQVAAIHFYIIAFHIY